MTTVLVTGARGKTGREVTALLAGRPGISLRAGSRFEGTLAVPGGEPVKFDWEDPKSCAAAMQGADAVFLVRPEIGDAPERIGELLEAADGVERVVMVSEQGADGLSSSSWERRVEDVVIDHADSWTILRGSVFHQILIDEYYLLESVRDQDTIEWPTAGAGIGFVDTRDIAAVAVEALLGDAHANQSYTLTGPEAVTFDHIADRLGAALGRTITYVDQPIRDCLDGFFGAGSPPSWMSGYYEGVMERICAGVFAELTDTVETVCGRQPRNLDVFIDEHVAHWRPVARAS